MAKLKHRRMFILHWMVPDVDKFLESTTELWKEENGRCSQSMGLPTSGVSTCDRVLHEYLE